MHNLTIKEPRAPQEHMTSVHGDYVTPNVIFVGLTNTQRQDDVYLAKLTSKHTVLKELDGDQGTMEPMDEEETKEATKVTKEVKEVYALVRNITNQDLDLLPGSAMLYPGFVRQITNDPGGVSAHSTHDTLA